VSASVSACRSAPGRHSFREFGGTYPRYYRSGFRPIAFPRPFPIKLGGGNDVAGSIGACRPPDSFTPTGTASGNGNRWTIDGFAAAATNFISGRQIEVIDATAQDGSFHVTCPTTKCPSNVEDWVYPDEIAKPPDQRGRRVIRVVVQNPRLKRQGVDRG
jgi:hypothetical protein